MIPKKICYLCVFTLTLVMLASVAHAQVGGGFEEKKTYQDHIDDRAYSKALEILEKKKTTTLTIPQKKLILYLQTFKEVDAYQPTNNPLVSSEEDMDPDVVKKVKSYYRAAQIQLVTNKSEVAKDILIYSLYLWPNHPKSERMLELSFDMVPGTYKPNDVAKKYFNRSANYFYGGNYLNAAKDLEVLAVLEQYNPMVFEQLGSSYYMMNEKQKAVDAWTTAKFLNPKNKKLDEIIATTKKAIISEAKIDPRAGVSELANVQIDDPQMMGVFKKQGQAFDMAQKLRDQGLSKIKIEETDNGKYKVIVSREELLANQGKKKK